jgi:hypothetical protein
MAKDTKKYGQILGEYKAILLASQQLKKAGLLKPLNLLKIENEYNTQYQHYVNSSTDMKALDKYMKKMHPLFEATADDIVEYVKSKSPKNCVNIINMSKSGLGSVKTTKSDLLIEIDDTKIDVSLKQYEKDSSIQLCSGTYLSTVCSLSFQRIGNGKFQDLNGRQFLSRNLDDVKSVFASHYGTKAATLVQQIKDLDQKYWHFRTMEVYPGDSVWLNTTKEVGQLAVSYISQLMQIVSDKSADLKQSLLERTGLDGEHEILITANCSSPKTYSTLTNMLLRKKVKSLNKSDTVIEVTTKGQSVKFSFVNGTDTITSLLMPCTINKNGAWHIPKDGITEKYCNKSKLWIKPNHLRPKKAKEMYTSTNFYLDIKKL